jgi:hypothetical protein
VYINPPGLERAPKLMRRDERRKKIILVLVNLAIIKGGERERERDTLFMGAETKVPFENKQGEQFILTKTWTNKLNTSRERQEACKKKRS